MENIIEVKNLVKSFSDKKSGTEVKAVNDLSFCVKEGELFAFLGVNGAGKSTSINIICGQLKKDGGSVRICGTSIDEDADFIKRKLGVVFQSSVLDKDLTVRENLENRACLYGIIGEEFKSRLKEVSALLELDDIMKRPAGKLSGGQRRRADIARALIHKPEILILDEPTTGLDPQTRRMLWNVVSGLRKNDGMTVFLTTHYMEEAADADYVLILDRGKIAVEGTPLELKNKYADDYINLYNVSEEKVKALGVPYERLHDAFRARVKNTSVATDLILRYPEVFTDFEIIKGKMDDVFLAVTGKELGGDNK